MILLRLRVLDHEQPAAATHTCEETIQGGRSLKCDPHLASLRGRKLRLWLSTLSAAQWTSRTLLEPLLDAMVMKYVELGARKLP